MNRKNIIMHFKGQEEFVSRMLDLDDRAYRQRGVIFTPFLNESEQTIIHRLPLSCHLFMEGGYEQAELKRAAFTFENISPVFPIVILKANYDEKFHQISHRDVLGAFMNLGIERNVLGDILVQEKELYIIVVQEIADFVKWNLNMVKHCRVQLEEVNYLPMKLLKMEFTEIIISSFRLDVIVSSLTHLARDKAKLLIRSGQVKVNQVVLEDYDYLCNNNSTISIRRYGRFMIENLQRRTKKDRYVIRVGRYV